MLPALSILANNSSAAGVTQTNYDPISDVVRFFADWRYIRCEGKGDVDIALLKSHEEAGLGGVVKYIIFNITVMGKIVLDSNHYYASFIGTNTGNYVIIVNGNKCIMVNADTGNEIPVAYWNAKDSSLVIKVSKDAMGNPTTMNWMAAAADVVSDNEIYADVAPDHIPWIERPYDGEWVWGTIRIEGKIRLPITKIVDVKIKIDEQNYVSVSKDSQDWSKWHYTLDTTKLGKGLHRITVKAIDENNNEFFDSIAVYVDQSLAQSRPTANVLKKITVGDYYEYSSTNEASFGVGSVFGTSSMWMKVVGYEPNPMGAGYVWIIRTHQESEGTKGTYSFSSKMDRYEWRSVTDYSLVKENESILFYGSVFGRREINTVSTYTPPLLDFNYTDGKIWVGKAWNATYLCTSHTNISDGDRKSYDNSNTFTYHYRFLGTKNISALGRIYETYALYWQKDDGLGYTIYYYAPSIDMIVRMENYDSSRNLVSSLVISKLNRGDGTFITIKDVNAPAKGVVGEKVEVKVRVRNSGNNGTNSAYIALYLENEEVVNETFAIGADEEKEVTIEFTPTDEGNFTLYIKTKDDVSKPYRIVIEKKEVACSGGFGNVAIIGGIIALLAVIALIAIARARTRARAGKEGKEEGEEEIKCPNCNNSFYAIGGGEIICPFCGHKIR